MRAFLIVSAVLLAILFVLIVVSIVVVHEGEKDETGGDH